MWPALFPWHYEVPSTKAITGFFPPIVLFYDPEKINLLSSGCLHISLRKMLLHDQKLEMKIPLTTHFLARGHNTSSKCQGLFSYRASWKPGWSTISYFAENNLQEGINASQWWYELSQINSPPSVKLKLTLGDVLCFRGTESPAFESTLMSSKLISILR